MPVLYHTQPGENHAGGIALLKTEKCNMPYQTNKLDHEDTKTQRLPLPAGLEKIATKIVHATFIVHSTLGPGLLESAYETCLAHELEQSGLQVCRQVQVPIYYGDLEINNGFRIDLLVEGAIILELKAVDRLLPIHKAQVLTYLKLTHHRLAFLINFNVPIIKDGIKRIIL
jgi:GxxExxY protein